MKLWEIKAQSLRIMFADTDVEFDEEDFLSQAIYNNANTREKLVRMEDSIRRAIDLFYQYNGEMIRITTGSLVSTTELDVTTYQNVIDMSGVADFGYPTRVDVVENLDNNIFARESIAFNYDRIDKKIYFTRNDYTSVGEYITFTIYFKMTKKNLPPSVSEMTYDLDLLYIPEEVQRMIPYFVKSELYEEDEASTAAQSLNKYINFLVLNQRKNYSKVSNKVKSNFNWGSE